MIRNQTVVAQTLDRLLTRLESEMGMAPSAVSIPRPKNGKPGLRVVRNRS